MSALISLLPLLIRIISMILDKGNADAQTKKEFLEWANKAAARGLISTKLKASYDSQLERIRAQLEQENRPPQP